MSQSTPAQTHGWTSYRQLAHTPDAKRLLLGFTLARLPVGMVALTLVLSTVQNFGSLALGGGVSAAYGIAMAIGIPVTGRMVDRHGAGWVLLVTGVAYPAALLLFAGVVAGVLPGPAWSLFVAAALAGLVLPPAAPVIRSVWATLLDEPNLRTATAIESMLTHTFYVLGPALVGLLAVIHATPVALVISAVANAVGLALILGSSRVRGLPTSSRRLKRWAALQQSGMRDLLLIALAYTVAGTSFEFAIIGWADARHTPALAGVLLAVSCVAGLLAAAAYGAGYPWLTRLPLSWWFGAWAVGLALLGWAVASNLGPGWVLLASLPQDAISAPILILSANLAVKVATSGLNTATYAWRLSAIMVGGSLSAAVCGIAAQRLGGFGPSGIGIVVAIGATVIASRSVLESTPDSITATREQGLTGVPAVGELGSPCQEKQLGQRGEGHHGRALHERRGLDEGVELI